MSSISKFSEKLAQVKEDHGMTVNSSIIIG